ncbi:hypothetical protein HMN09_00802600 [Mycena chlorophos]|uniref:Uncharacterized protein n=1 Tax=Mycena chlorophos TaxID=658473 RepID=A0A8H6SUH7_MYCCL|nr:hypothetical protein HMN09_00802600 [Mycena chlorophos]
MRLWEPRVACFEFARELCWLGYGGEHDPADGVEDEEEQGGVHGGAERQGHRGGRRQAGWWERDVSQRHSQPLLSTTMILLNAQGTALLQRSHSGSELPECIFFSPRIAQSKLTQSRLPSSYITSNRTQPPRYSRVRKPKNPLSYTFTMPDSENAGSAVLMVPPPESDDQARYRVAVSLNLNPFIPICYRTTVHRVLHGQESFIGDFELSLNHRRAIVSLGDVTTRLVNVLYSINSSPRHWTWRWDDIGLRWDCRNTLEDGSPMCICYTLASTTQLATFVPPPFDAPPPLPEAVLTIFPDGHDFFDHILLSALIVQRKMGLEF